MLNSDKIQKFSKKLQNNKDFKNRLLGRIAEEIYSHIKTQKKESPILVYDENQYILALKKLMVVFFDSPEFWEQKANWILSMLDTWNTEKQEPLTFPTLEDLPKPTSSTIKQKESYLIELCAFNTALEILKTLNIPSLSVEVLENLLGLNRNRFSYSTEPRLSQISHIPSSALIVSSIQAQLKKDLWQQNSDGLAVFRYQSKRNLNNQIEHYITDSGDITLLPWQNAEQIIDKFGFDTVKLQLLFAAYTMKQNEPWRSSFILRASDIIKDLGWDKNHHSNLPEKRNQIASLAYALSSLLVKAVWIEGIGKNQINVSTPTGRMWEVLIDPHGQINLLTGKVDRPDEVYLTVRPGLWTENFLNRAGQTAREALYQFGYLALNILKIDPYHDELALRLAIHLTLDSRIRALDKNPYDYQVKSLLHTALPETVIEAALTDKYKARDLKKRWNNALTLLVKLGWQINFDETYPEWLRPGSEVPKSSNWRKIKTIERLLESYLTIEPPDPIPQRLATIAKPKKPQKSKLLPAHRLTGEQIRTGREVKGWTRKQLGGMLDLSVDYVGKLERGDRALTPELEAKLRKLLFISD